MRDVLQGVPIAVAKKWDGARNYCIKNRLLSNDKRRTYKHTDVRPETELARAAAQDGIGFQELHRNGE